MDKHGLDPRELVKLEIGPTTPEDIRVAEQELRETPERVQESLQALTRLIESDRTLNVPLKPDFLIRFLRPTKFYPESALKLLKNALEFRDSHKDLLQGLMPEDEKRAFLDTETVNVLVRRDALGRRILVIFAGHRWDTDKLSTDQIFRLFYIVHQVALLEERTQIHGGIVIIDFDGLSMKHVRSLGPSFALRLLNFCQDSMPLRLKAVHILHQPFIFNIIWNIFKPFLKDKLKRRVFFHGAKLQSLHAMISRDELPADFGGNQPAINYTSRDWYPVIREREAIIEEYRRSELARTYKAERGAPC